MNHTSSKLICEMVVTCGLDVSGVDPKLKKDGKIDNAVNHAGKVHLSVRSLTLRLYLTLFLPKHLVR